MTPPQHLSFFTKASMSLMTEAAGRRIVEIAHPWKKVPLSLIAYQLQRMIGLIPRKVPALSSLYLPMNLWDAIRVVAVK
jgi:hypothetical protein